MRKSFAGFYALLIFFAAALLAGGTHLCAQDKSFLWKVESSKGMAYLLGSIHLLRRDDMALKPVIDEVFDKAKRLVFEVDLLSENPEKMQKLMMQRGLNPDGKLLYQIVSSETFSRVGVWANSLGIDLRLLIPMKPWVAGMTLGMLQLQKLGYDPQAGVDRQLARRAQVANKLVSGLESVESLIDLYDQMPAEYQEKMLRYSIEEMGQINKDLDEIVRVWRTGDVAMAEQYFLRRRSEYPDIQEKLLDQRNRNWLPQIEKFIDGGETTLVVVGAAHLVGKNGLVELLKARGYKMEQL